ncbi:LysM peptidoglycan-binding domain-containing protein [Sphingobacterium corticis]|uniref:LysM peptidoglycan-binding domain-containing protein n=1 Tax=Sphingobacterium corticis TaxID=1812823 RepID=A0ABW5NE43_9SPHI
MQQAVQKQLEKERETVIAHLDSIKEATITPIEFSYDDIVIGQRIQRMQKSIPMEYNHLVKAYLDKYVSRNYQPYMEKLLGLSQYYFPIYEQIFAENNIPDEIKFLSVVESSLNPHTLSSAGALGPWQFIYGTAKGYNLAMDSYVDERKDVYLSTYAVSKYLTEAHDEFNDWLLALASYNCGRGCVRRAIQRSGMRAPTFWELSPYLPQETRNYIPKFIAMSYVLQHPDMHHLTARTTDLALPYKVMMVDKHVDMSRIASAINCPLDILQAYNPAFKKTQVNGSAADPKRLIVPVKQGLNDSLLYMALNNQTVPFQEKESFQYIVKSGETLATIAKANGVSVSDLITWNDLPVASVPVGKSLRIEKETSENIISARLANNVNKAKAKEGIAKKQMAYVLHVVRKGDTLSSIASKYRGASINRLKADNNIKTSHLSIGQKIKVFQAQS